MNKKYGLVLVVDDDAVTRVMNILILKSIGLADRIDSAKDGKCGLEALVKYATHKEDQVKPILVLLDLMMPIMDGFKFLEEYNQLPIDKDQVSICVLSSSCNEQDRRRASILGVSGYIEKPLTEEKLRHSLR